MFHRVMLVRKARLAIENLALRQQLTVYKQHVKRPRLRPRDRIFWVWLSRLWSHWQSALLIVQPETVIRWHRQGFKLYWRWKSRGGKPGRRADRTRNPPPDWQHVPGERHLGCSANRIRTGAVGPRCGPADCGQVRGPAKKSTACRPGGRFWTITCPISWRATSSPCRPPRSACCTFSSFFGMTGVRLFNLTLRQIRVPNGPHSRSSMPSRTKKHLVFSFAIAMISTVTTSRIASKAWASKKFRSHHAHLVRIPVVNAALAPYAESVWIV